MGTGCGGKLSVPLLSVGIGRTSRKRLCQSIAGICHPGCESKKKVRYLYAGGKKQKAWLSDQSFAKKFGFVSVDTTESGYELLALSFDGTYPCFAERAKAERIISQDLTIYYDMQCPFVWQTVEKLRKYCEENQIPAHFIEVDTLEKAKDLPCVFQNWSVFYHGKFETVNLLDVAALQKIWEK